MYMDTYINIRIYSTGLEGDKGGPDKLVTCRVGPADRGRGGLIGGPDKLVVGLVFFVSRAVSLVPIGFTSVWILESSNLPLSMILAFRCSFSV
jgi:hypothetical protein